MNDGAFEVQCSSTLRVENRTDFELRVLSVSLLSDVGDCGLVGVGEILFVPVEHAGCNEVRVQLASGVKDSSPILVSRGVESSQLAKCDLASGDRFFFHASLQQVGAVRHLVIEPSFVFRNHLPFDIEARVRAPGAKWSEHLNEQSGRGVVKAGADAGLYRFASQSNGGQYVSLELQLKQAQEPCTVRLPWTLCKCKLGRLKSHEAQSMRIWIGVDAHSNRTLRLFCQYCSSIARACPRAWTGVCPTRSTTAARGRRGRRRS